jgi:transformer-2 protein
MSEDLEDGRRRPDSRHSSSPDTGRDGDTHEGHGEAEHVNLYVRGVAPLVTDEEMESAFAAFGKVVSCSVVRDPHTKECRGFAFVKLASLEAAEAAMSTENGITICGRQLNVERARRNGPHEKTPGQYLGVDRSVRDRYAGHKRGHDEDGGEHGRGGGYGGGRDFPAYRRGDFDGDRYNSRRRFSPGRRPASPERGYGRVDREGGRYEPGEDYRGSHGFDRTQPHRADDGRGHASHPRRDGPPPVQPRDGGMPRDGGSYNFGRDRR